VTSARTVVVVAAACCALVGVAGCQSGAAGGAVAPGPTVGTATTTPPTTTTTLTLSRPPLRTPQPTVPSPDPQPPTGVQPPPASGTAVPHSQIHAVHMLTPPQTVATAGDDVVFVAQQSGCAQVSAKATAQTATSVTIVVLTTIITRGNEMCPMYVREVPIVVPLAAPLGDRELIFQGETVRL
jgi:hypothetical protein